MLKSIKSKKSQAWSIDLIVAITIFISGIIIFYIYILNFSNEGEEAINDLFYDGNIITSILLSEGSPSDWNQLNVLSPGLTSNDKINETKLEKLYNFANSDYKKLKSALNTKFDFYIYFTEKISINGTLVDGIGKTGVDRENIIQVEAPRNIVKITRITAYKNKPTEMNLYIWD